MSVQVEGSSLQDVVSQLGRLPNENWITINPAPGKDYSRKLELGFTVRCVGRDEGFSKKVSSLTELLRLITPLLRRKEAEAKKAIAEEEATHKENAQKAVKQARAALKAS